jgi:hypothetical protein
MLHHPLCCYLERPAGSVPESLSVSMSDVPTPSPLTSYLKPILVLCQPYEIRESPAELGYRTSPIPTRSPKPNRVLTQRSVCSFVSCLASALERDSIRPPSSSETWMWRKLENGTTKTAESNHLFRGIAFIAIVLGYAIFDEG